MNQNSKHNRSDAWTPEDDAILSEIVLRNIREGSTQLNAFQEASLSLNRTPAACGFRWNGVLRKLYAEKINEAKATKREVVLRGRKSKKPVIDQSEPMISTVIRALKSHELNYLRLMDKTHELEEKVSNLELQLSMKVLQTDQNMDILTLLNRAKQILDANSNIQLARSVEQKDLA